MKLRIQTQVSTIRSTERSLGGMRSSPGASGTASTRFFSRADSSVRRRLSVTLTGGMHTDQGAESWAQLMRVVETVGEQLDPDHPIGAALRDLHLVDRAHNKNDVPAGIELFLPRVAEVTEEMERVAKALEDGMPVDTERALAVLYGRV